MQDPHFFGYGSLVNRDTHVYTPCDRATLHGWGREWRSTTMRPVAFLTAYRAPDLAIDGLIAPVPGEDWAALDLRETGYDRVPTDRVDHPLDPDTRIAVYSIPDGREPAGAPLPVLLSYLDVVVQGYLREFGEDGVARFFQTTRNWHHPVAEDRDAPLYPRAQTLTEDEAALVDRWLLHLDVARIPPSDTLDADDDP